VSTLYEDAEEQHRLLKGKITTSLRDTPDSRQKLSTFYSPGVGGVASIIAKNPELLPVYTWTNNLVAVISDGSAVLGLGDIGPEGAMPVMEGKAMLFKHFANIDAVPIILDVHEPKQIIEAVKSIYKSFGAINLEDIAAPKCFEIERVLKEELPIPIMHDDQHGTAIVTLAGIINALKVVGKTLETCKIVIIGAGAAGTAVAHLLFKAGAKTCIVVDSKGIIHSSRDDLTQEKTLLATYNNTTQLQGELTTALEGADVVIGLSKAGMITAEHIKMMAAQPVVFAMANPEPEILPDEAKAAGAAIVATGRSDFPNQVNNSLAFPGIFRGALDNGVQKITDEHKMNAAYALAALVAEPTAEKIIPGAFDAGIVAAVAAVIV
jgi:malate dehydrogenase (oxaloacetate-decarboxylating)